RCIIIPVCGPDTLGMCAVFGARFKTVDAALTPPFILDGITQNHGGDIWRQWCKAYVLGVVDQYGSPMFPSMADAEQCADYAATTRARKELELWSAVPKYTLAEINERMGM